MTGLLFPKGEPRRVTKARQQRDEATLRRECADAVWARAAGRCENPACGRRVVRPERATWLGAAEVGHVHEQPPRSRGGDPTDPATCVLTCKRCHDRLHGRADPRLRLARGDDGAWIWTG